MDFVTTSATNETGDYDQGDWVVHCHHGIGQIEAIEHKRIGEQENKYFCIKTADSVIWIPVEQMDKQHFRPIVDETDFQEAVAVLRRPPKGMDSNLSTRMARIKQVTADNVPTETARMIRDLRARRREKKGLNLSERQALRDLTKRFLQEWSVCVGLTLKQARRQLNRQLTTRRSATQNSSAAGQKDDRKREATPILDALAKRDDRWSDWYEKKIVKGM
jgi:RNA polymerase-interacting CarD/CdnL/TRCF family regulator